MSLNSCDLNNELHNLEFKNCKDLQNPGKESYWHCAMTSLSALTHVCHVSTMSFDVQKSMHAHLVQSIENYS